MRLNFFKIKTFTFVLILALGISGQISAQQRTIEGRVTDNQEMPLPGVTIVVQGTTIGTVTNGDGEFSLDIPLDSETLQFSFVGMRTQEIPIDGKTTFTVVMEEETIGIEEVVAVGYGTMRKSDLTGSVVRADIESFREAPNVNIAQSLHGNVPGLNIGQVDQAGENPSILIRGRNTLSGNQNVLIVLDGIVYSGGLSDLNPRDIESIDILKDPSSKAIYGAQAANGVMIITTKSGGKEDRSVINFSSSFATQNPSAKIRTLNREEYIQKSFDMDWQKAYEAPDYVNLKPNLGEIYRDIAVGAPYVEGYDNGTDFSWWDNATSPGYIQNHSLGISGNYGEKFTYYTSGGYTKQKGFILNDEFERFTIRINLENRIYDWLKIGTQTFGSFSDYSGTSPSLSNITSFSPLLSSTDQSGNYINYPTGTNTLNPFLAPEADDFDKRNSLFGKFYVDINFPFIKGLNYQFILNGNYLFDKHYYSNQYDLGLNGRAYKQNDHQKELTLDHIISYNRIFDDHRIDITLVSGQREINFERTNASGSIYNDLSLSYNKLDLASTQLIQSSAWEENYLYQMARLNYSYRSKYLLTTTIRRDGFSGFAANRKIANFPSIGIGWMLAEEDFFDVNWVNNLKLRASYGKNGNLASRYSSLARMNIFNAYVFGDGGSTALGQQPTRMPNDFLTWETTTGYNFGLDFSILNNKLSAEIDYYLTTTTDLLYNVSLPQITGYSSIFSNLGKIANRGIELSLNYRVIKLNEFSWFSNFNFSSNKNTIKSLLGLDLTGDGKEDDLIESGLFIGESINSIYDYESAGIIQFGEEIPQGWFVGTHRIIDQNNDGIINSADRTIIGREEPAFLFGLFNEFQYKSFTFKFFINSIQGGKNGYLGEANTMTKAVGDNMRRNNIFTGIDYWTPSNPNARYRRLDAEPAIDYVYYGDRSFVRLQDITASYDFNNFAKKIGFQNIKLFISGKNLYTWTKWEGWDPETGSGLEYGGRPVMKSWSIGFDVIL